MTGDLFDPSFSDRSDGSRLILGGFVISWKRFRFCCLLAAFPLFWGVPGALWSTPVPVIWAIRRFPGVDLVRSMDYTADILAVVVWIDSAPCCGFCCTMFNAFKSQLKPFFASVVHL